MIATKQTSYLQFAELVAISTLHTIATVITVAISIYRLAQIMGFHIKDRMNWSIAKFFVLTKDLRVKGILGPKILTQDPGFQNFQIVSNR